MYPSKILAGTQSNAERKVYSALKDNLPDTFSVFHSVPLLVRSQKAPALLPREIDFLVCQLAGHPLSWTSSCPSGAIACATIHSFKGLESPVVILTEMVEPDINRLRQLSYVGCSRAKSHLVVVGRVGSDTPCYIGKGEKP
jgi:superfamily I DNA/RNA helicase